ncbi:16S rRNA (uracil(1498)-N(3))-methyltransferase [Alteribacillus bidgolensis]|uniref:Ribosomal RNA small subunit methyltransferase E n=1 Tax=Alteribacillus bidgolensis TaxID=930129 RepID=A0A1G8NYU8_9BACI|nr:16S rRNA (uracil(1498)-N(3))-methyltransferase [Alteribacillus bidgolensis]SDI85471.1 16S rRNA (uracil1498-N3)-methyltransferase [Alteribacillus bidgolensis]
MQRYFVKPENMTVSHVVVTGEDVKHISKVMRMAPGDKIVCLDNQGRQVVSKINDINQDFVKADIIQEIHENNELPLHVTIAQGLIKGDKLDLVIQKGTEFGASAFYLFSADRSVVKWDGKKINKKLERLQKIAKEAAEQSGRRIIPSITFFSSWKEMLKEKQNHDANVFLYEENAKKKLHSDLSEVLNLSPASLLAIIGPEGGVSEEEASAYRKECFRNISLGPRVLRSESASLYLLAALSYQYELLR